MVAGAAQHLRAVRDHRHHRRGLAVERTDRPRRGDDARDQVSENRAQDLRLAQGNYITCQVQNRQAGTARALRTIVLAISPFPRDRSPELYDALANYRKLTAKKRVPRDCGVRPVGISDEVLP